ncbi:MAG: hypothetical protein ACRC6I_08085 [Paracoccaceae bacterium]
MLRLAAITALLSTPAWAETYPYQESGGGLYDLVVEEEQALLISQSDKADMFTVNTTCQAFHPVHGEGTWDYGNGGWRIVINGAVVAGFPRQEAPLTAPACAN